MNIFPPSGKISVAELLESEASRLLKEQVNYYTLDREIEYGARAINAHIKSGKTRFAIISILHDIKHRNKKY